MDLHDVARVLKSGGKYVRCHEARANASESDLAESRFVCDIGELYLEQVTVPCKNDTVQWRSCQLYSWSIKLDVSKFRQLVC